VEERWVAPCSASPPPSTSYPTSVSPALRALETVFSLGAVGNLSDGELLDCFRTQRGPSGEQAFRALVERHGPLVLGLCRRLVKDSHDAEDAFQATFLILMQKAGSIRSRENLGPWLYGVASRVARRVRRRSLARVNWPRHALAEVPARAEPASACDTAESERAILDEISRLPERLRGPIVLCCLEGQSYELAAARLALTEPALRGRLYRARNRLSRRLRARGISGGSLTPAIILSGGVSPRVSAELFGSTVKMSLFWQTARGLVSHAAVVPEPIATLAHGVTTTMMLHGLNAAGVVSLLAAAAVGTAVLAQQARNPPAQTGAGSGSVLQTETKAAAALASTSEGSPQANHDEGAVSRPELIWKELRSNGDVAGRNRLINEYLDKPIDAHFPEGTVHQVLKHIKQVTTVPGKYPGIPIYFNGVVDPAGKAVQDPDKMTVRFDAKQRPARLVLETALRPHGLSYIVKDGFLFIDARDGINEIRLQQLEKKMDRVLEALERLTRAR
jgi:RNA polymerase sigma factor (sigma-70 family)